MSSGIVRTSDLSNYTICSLTQSRETIPLKFKKKPIREYLELIIYPIKPSAGLFFLVKSRDPIPVKTPFLPNYRKFLGIA
jgi:hypothetical protein